MKKYTPYLFCLAVGALMITICSTCSFLYATNSWVDVNCIFTASRSMAHGQVLYRDIMDHKGFYLYIINILGYLISRRSFFGLYIMEILFFSAFLAICWKIFLLYVSKPTALRLVPLTAAVAAACNSFDAGASTEEFALPLAAASIYFMLRWVSSGCDPKKMDGKTVLLNGALAGVVLWMKYTMLGLWFGFMAMVFFLMLSKKQYRQAFLSCLIFLGGMAAATVPVLLYFGVHGALKDCWQVYFYDNIFLYPSAGGSLADRFSVMIQFYLRQSKGNPMVTLFVWGGMAWFLFFNRKITGILERLALPVMYGFLLLGIYWGCKNYWYYFLITAPFAVTGAAALGWFWDHTSWAGFWTGKKHAVMTAGLCLVCAIWSWFSCNNADIRQDKWEDTPQYQFAQVMAQSEHPTLQVYNFHDYGFYNALDIIPTSKYFTLVNFNQEVMPEMYNEQYQTIYNQEVEYVICMTSVPSFIMEHYYPVSYHENSGCILLKRNGDSRYTTAWAGWEQGDYLETIDGIDWTVSQAGGTVLEGTLAQPAESDGLEIRLEGWTASQPPECSISGADGVFTAVPVSSDVTINGVRFLRLEYPVQTLERIRLSLPAELSGEENPKADGSSDGSGKKADGAAESSGSDGTVPENAGGTPAGWQARIDVMAPAGSFSEPLYLTPIEKTLGHENSVTSPLAMDNDFGSCWTTGTEQAQGQVFDIMLNQSVSGLRGIKLTLDANTEEYPRDLLIYSTPDNAAWGPLDASSGNQRDFFFNTPSSVMLRLITGENSGGSGQPWSINEVYLWQEIDETERSSHE